MPVQVLRYGKEWHNFMASPQQYKSLKKHTTRPQAEEDEEDEEDELDLKLQ